MNSSIEFSKSLDGTYREQILQNMRRNTLLPHKPPVPLAKNRRHRTMIENEISLLSLPKQNQSLKSYFTHSETIARDFIDNTLMIQIEEEMNRRELKKIVDQTMNQCINLFQNQNWQINPDGPFTQAQKDSEIKLDEQPQVIRFDPILGFDKTKKYKPPNIQTQTSLQLSRLKMTCNQKQFKSTLLKQGSKNSINTHRTITSKLNSTFSNDVPKLVPLKLENNPNTPQGSYRRNLEDILREKKINAQINLGYKMKYFDEKENHGGLKTIQELSKASFIGLPFKAEVILEQNSLKLPLISIKQDASMDYDGGLIPLKKMTNPKKSTQILKTVCKVKKSVDQNKKPLNPKKKLETVKIRVPKIRKDSQEMLSLTARNSCGEDMKSIIEQNLHTNRIRFREMDQNEPTPVYDLPQ